MAAPASTASPASWNPAVPPPPVIGAAVGIGLGDGVGLAEGEPVSLVDSDGLVEVLSPAGGLVPPKASLLCEPVALGDNTDSDEEWVLDPGPVAVLVPVLVPVPDPVQAESATQASMVTRPQPTAVSLIPYAVPAMAVRALIGPPSYSRP